MKPFKLFEIPIESVEKNEAEMMGENAPAHQTVCMINPCHITDAIKYHDDDKRCSIRIMGCPGTVEIFMGYDEFVKAWNNALFGTTPAVELKCPDCGSEDINAIDDGFMCQICQRKFTK
jgi:hypothetical protein